jgi:hypothetical protein
VSRGGGPEVTESKHVIVLSLEGRFWFGTGVWEQFNPIPGFWARFVYSLDGSHGE